jgi:hypothetical protein
MRINDTDLKRSGNGGVVSCLPVRVLTDEKMAKRLFDHRGTRTKWLLCHSSVELDDEVHWEDGCDLAKSSV